MSLSQRRRPADFRSDTVTRPSRRMRAAMAAAEVGDDFYGEDPTVRRLEERASALLGTQDAVFVVGGTMANLTAVLALVPRGRTVLAEADSDLVRWEAHSLSALAGVGVMPLQGLDGRLPADALGSELARDDPRAPRPGMVVVENSHCASGGRAWRPGQVTAVAAAARKAGVPVLCDGARLLNAAVAVGCAPDALTRDVEAVTLSLYKGLGAPMGALVGGTAATAAAVREARRMLGATFRQAGVVAAAGLLGLDEWHRLADDHARARRLHEGLRSVLPPGDLMPDPPETNIVLMPLGRRAGRFVQRMGEHGIRLTEITPGTVRWVTHVDVDDGDVDAGVAATAAVLADGHRPMPDPVSSPRC